MLFTIVGKVDRVSNVSIERTYDDEATKSSILHIPSEFAKKLGIVNGRVLIHLVNLNSGGYLMLSKYREEILIT